MAVRGIIGDILSRETARQHALSKMPIVDELRNIRVEIAQFDVWSEKIILSVDPKEWDVKVLSYKEHPGLQATWADFTEIMVVGIEDLPTEEMADNWRDVIMQITWLEYLEPVGSYKIGDKALILGIWNLAFDRGVKVYYLDKLIYDSSTDGWRKPWIILKEEIAEVV